MKKLWKMLNQLSIFPRSQVSKKRDKPLNFFALLCKEKHNNLIILIRNRDKKHRSVCLLSKPRVKLTRQVKRLFCRGKWDGIKRIGDREKQQMFHNEFLTIWLQMYYVIENSPGGRTQIFLKSHLRYRKWLFLVRRIYTSPLISSQKCIL